MIKKDKAKLINSKNEKNMNKYSLFLTKCRDYLTSLLEGFQNLIYGLLLITGLIISSTFYIAISIIIYPIAFIADIIMTIIFIILFIIYFIITIFTGV